MVAFSEYLVNAGIPVNQARDFASTKTIFMNKNLNFKSLSLWKDYSIITYAELSNYMKSSRSGLGTDFLMALVELLAKNDAEKIGAGFDYNLTKMVMNKVSTHLKNIRTWDEIQLFGGRIGTGDSLQLSINNKIFSLLDRDRVTAEGIKIN